MGSFQAMVMSLLRELDTLGLEVICESLTLNSSLKDLSKMLKTRIEDQIPSCAANKFKSNCMSGDKM